MACELGTYLLHGAGVQSSLLLVTLPFFAPAFSSSSIPPSSVDTILLFSPPSSLANDAKSAMHYSTLLVLLYPLY